MKTLPLILSTLALPLFLGGCDQLSNKMGLEDPAKKEARLDAEGKAVGGGCRHSGRAIEDCYAIYTWLPKESVFTGWREMDEYMRSNNLETVAPQLPPPPARRKRRRPPPCPRKPPEPKNLKRRLLRPLPSPPTSTDATDSGSVRQKRNEIRDPRIIPRL